MASSFKASPNVTSGDTQASGSTHQFTGSVEITGSLTLNGSAVTGGGGSGDVSGPGSATDNAIVRFDGAGGKTIQNSSVTIDDSNNMTGVVAITTTGNATLGNAASDYHQVSGTLSISGSQPLIVYGPTGAYTGAPSIIARSTASVGESNMWEQPASGALIVSADPWDDQPNGAVMYVHSPNAAAIVGFKNSSTLVSGIQKNAVTSNATKGAFIGLQNTDMRVRNHIGNVVLTADGSTEITISNDGTTIGNSASDYHQVTGTLGVLGDMSASLNISASAYYGDGSNLSGIGQSYDTITATTKTAAIDTTYYVTPHTSNTTVTLPAAGTAGSTIKFIFDSLTGVDRYCDIGVTSAAAFKTPFSSGATNMRLWKPCDVTFLDNGTEWTAMEGTCYEIQPWFLNETVGSLGHGLVEAVPFGQMSGFGCAGLLMGTGWQQRDQSLNMQTNTFKNESLLDSDNNPLYFGKTYRRETTYRGLFCESREDLVLTGSVQQFFVFVGHTGASYTSDSTAHRYLSNSDGSSGYSFMMYKNGGSDNIFVGVKDSSANVSSFLSDAYTDDTLFQFAWGLDTVSPWYSESGSAPAAMPTDTPAVATDFADIDNPVGTMLCKGLGDWQVGSTRACGAWFYHGRARWSDAEAADFWEIRTSGSAKVFL